MKFSGDVKDFRFFLTFFLGFLIAIPLTYPSEPFYWFAIFSFCVAIFYINLGREDVLYFLLVFMLAILTLFANLHSPLESKVNYISAVATSVTTLFFLFRFCLNDVERFLSGFLFVGKIYALLVPVAFIILAPYHRYGNFFVNSEARMWAEGYFPEWPNVFCVFLILSFFIFFIRHAHFWAFLSLAAALLTTSRMALLGVVLFLIFYILNATIKKRLLVIGFLFFSFSVIAIYLSSNEFLLDYIQFRLLKSDDRMIIFETLYATFSSYPFGIGNVPFYELSQAFDSYHSSFLKVAVRYGFLGVLFFIIIVTPRKFWIDKRSYCNLPLVFLLIVGLVQDMLLHLHFILLYSVFLKYREERLRD